jgi:TonB family protein
MTCNIDAFHNGTINTTQLSIANHFNKSLTLKRIAMIKSLKQKMSGHRKLGLLLAIALIVVSISCEERIITDLKKATRQSVLLTEYPLEVHDAIAKIKSNNPNADLKVYGLVRTEDLQELDFGGKIPTMVFKSKDSDYQLYVILGSDAVELPVDAMFEMQNGQKVYSIVEQPAQPKNGMTDYYKFIGENLRYPEQARRMGVEGRVFVKFMVDENGTLSDFKVIRGIGAGCDAEALRVLSISPAWNPGKQRGETVKSTFNLAIVFKLENTPALSSSEEQIEVPVDASKKFYIEPIYERMKVQIQKFYKNGELYLEGTVINQKDNKALPGVNIVFKGRTEGTATDVNGTFKVKAPVSNGSIILSFVGFSTEEYSF